MSKPRVLNNRLSYGTKVLMHSTTERDGYHIMVLWETRKKEPADEPDHLDSRVECEHNAEIKDYAEKVWALVETLPWKDQFVLKLRLQEEMTLKETADLVGVTTSRVRQLELRAIRTIKMWIRDNVQAMGPAPDLQPYSYREPKHPGFAWNKPLT